MKEEIASGRLGHHFATLLCISPRSRFEKSPTKQIYRETIIMMCIGKRRMDSYIKTLLVEDETDN